MTLIDTFIQKVKHSDAPAVQKIEARGAVQHV
jgi:hypothetical protein